VLSEEAIAQEATLRRSIRRQQFANTLAIGGFALGLLAIAALLFVWSNARRPTDRPQVAAPPVAAAPTPPVAKAPVATPAATASIAHAAPSPAPRPVAPPAVAPKPRTSEGEPLPPAPRIRLSPPEPATAAAVPVVAIPAIDRPSGAPAKRMLNSIKCFDEFAFEGQAGGRQYFSARCKGGNRMQVSCAGAGCKIEYAPAPKHYPTGE
jgi:hypothetical protein